SGACFGRSPARWYARRARSPQPCRLSREPLGLCRDPGEEFGPRPRGEHPIWLDPCAAGLGDAPALEFELLDPMRIGVDRQQAPGSERFSCPGVGKIEPMIRAVDLEGGAGSGRLRKHLVPVEVQ